MLPGANASGLTAGGVITAPGPLAGIQFGPDGQPFGGYQFGQYYSPNAVFMLGGSSEGDRDAFLSGYLLKAPVRRYSLYSHFEAELGANLEAFAELSWGHVDAHAQSAQIRDKTIVIRQDNAYLPDSIRQTMIADNIPSFTFGRSGLDLGRAQIDVRTETFSSVAGLQGRIGRSWQWDVYYQYGRTDYRQLTSNDRITANFNLAVDAVMGPDGAIVCRSTLTNASNGCVPLNLFGENRFSQAAKDYTFGTARQDSTFTQHVVAANLSGSPFDTWAGPVQVAAGLEYRVNETESVADPISRNLGFYVANAQDIQGRAKISEGYVETVVPLLSDAPFARSLELNGALRQTHYSVAGNGTSNSFDATTWKIGAVWQPVPWLRIRATRSRDIRAANIAELFGARTQTFAVTADPQTLTSVFLPIPQPSNPLLTPEVADTKTIGFAIVPDSGFLSGFAFSADYYDIGIANAIARPGSQTVVTGCFNGVTDFCAYVTRNSAGVITGLVNPLLNLASQSTRGIDFDLSYRLPLQRVSGGMDGTVTFRALATYVADLVTNGIDRAGQTGFPVGGLPGVPHWLIDTTVGYQNGPLATTVQMRYIPGGYNDVTRIGPDSPDFNPALPNSVNINRLPSRFYVNVFGSYDFQLGESRSLQLFAGVNNLFDRDPPTLHNDQIATNGILFDTVGRVYRIGLRIRM
jgi:outer membrane receptor protein involved in Fe transport